jgi:hypothetical protein
MLLILVHPTGQGDDEKGKRVQERAHRRRLSCRLPHPLRPMISLNLSFCTVRDKRGLAPRAFADDERGMDFGCYIETERFWPGFGQDGKLHTPP